VPTPGSDEEAKSFAEYGKRLRKYLLGRGVGKPSKISFSELGQQVPRPEEVSHQSSM
jgi:hypothetical protein